MIIDRIEGVFAVIELENGKTVNMPTELLPDNAKEGDVLSIKVDNSITTKRENRLKNKMSNLFTD